MTDQEAPSQGFMLAGTLFWNAVIWVCTLYLWGALPGWSRLSVTLFSIIQLGTGSVLYAMGRDYSMQRKPFAVFLLFLVDCIIGISTGAGHVWAIFEGLAETIGWGI